MGRRRPLLIAVVLAVAVAGVAWQRRPRPHLAPEQALKAAWRLDLRQATPQRVLDALAANPFGVRVIGVLEPSAGQGYELHLPAQPLQQVFDAVAGLTGSRWLLQDNVVVFRSAAEPPDPAALARVRYLRQTAAFVRELTPAQQALVDQGQPLPLSGLTPLQRGIVKAIARRGSEPADLPDRALAAALRYELIVKLTNGDKLIAEIDATAAPAAAPAAAAAAGKAKR